MATIASPAAYVAAVAALLLSAIGVGLPSDSASAEDHCASAPGAAAPAGQHWYYSVDRVNHRKCWYLHGIVALPNHAAAKHGATPSGPAAAVATPQLPFAPTPPWLFAATPQATNAAAVPQPAADPPSEVVGTQPVPHVTMLAVKPVPALDTTSASHTATPDQAGEPPMRQIAPNDANSPMEDVAKPASGANPAAVPGATDAAHSALAPADALATGSARTQAADMFFLLALASGIAAALLALCSKMAGRTRTPLLSDHPDDTWRRVIEEHDAPFLAPREPHGRADWRAHGPIERSPPAKTDSPVARPRDGKPSQSEPVGSNLKDIELALRALAQARQSVSQA